MKFIGEIISNDNVAAFNRHLDGIMSYNTEFGDTIFESYLRDQAKLKPDSILFVLHSLAFILDSTDIATFTTRQGLDRIKQHLSSIGVYGKTAFLHNVYGLYSELCQAYCRYHFCLIGDIRLYMDLHIF